MALLKTAAFKIAQKTVINTTVGKTNITNLNRRKANNISNLSPNDPITKTIQDLITEIKNTAIKGEYVYITNSMSNLFSKKITKYLRSRKKYGIIKFGKSNEWKLVIYWGPWKRLMKYQSSDYMGTLNEPEYTKNRGTGKSKDNSKYYVKPDYTYPQTLKPEDWEKWYLRKTVFVDPSVLWGNMTKQDKNYVQA